MIASGVPVPFAAGLWGLLEESAGPAHLAVGSAGTADWAAGSAGLPALAVPSGFVVPQEVGRQLQYEQNEYDDDQNADHDPPAFPRPCSRFRLLRRAPSFACCIKLGERQCPRVLAGESMPRGSPGPARRAS